jgi:hypothetical protein
MRIYAGLGLILSFAAAGACSSSGDNKDGAASNGGNSGGASNDGSTALIPGHGSPVTSVAPVGSGNGCASQSLGATVLDIFVMLDKSASMDDPTASGRPKWDVISQALVTFVNDPKSAGIGAGLGFFGLGSGPDTSCTVADYERPVVPIAALTPNAQAISAAIGLQSPVGNTPTEPALQGAINYAVAWAQQHETHKVIVVFATDGLPNGCNSTVDGAAAVAATGVSATPSIPTYVIGVFGDEDCPGGVTQGSQCAVVDNTNQIAKGGGTNAAFIVNASGDTGTQFLQALNAIRTANLVGCNFAVPATSGGLVVNFSQATVTYTPGNGGAAMPLSWVSSASACDPTSGGWYYDNVTAPNQVKLCDASCTQVTGDPNARVDVHLGCGTSPPPATGGAPGAGGSYTCLLNGQSCTSPSDCCSGICAGGICGAMLH